MVSKKFVSKVDEKLRAAEARRAELERAKAEEIQKKLAGRRDRMKKVEADENSNINNAKVNATTTNNTIIANDIATAVTTKNNIASSSATAATTLDVKSFKYLRVKGGKLIKLNWNSARRVKKSKGVKLFTIKTVESLINEGDFEMAQVLLGIMRRAVQARHVIQNKFAQLHGRIVEIKETKKRTFTHESALNFTGSISPVRLPEFEADLNQLSRISSPVGMEELCRKYEGSIDMDSYNTTINTGIKTGIITKTPPESHYEYPIDDGMLDHLVVPATPSRSPRKGVVVTPHNNHQSETDQNNFPIVISPMKRPHKDIEAETVYTPQRKSARRLDSNELIYDDDQVSEILLNDPNSAFISNPYIPASTGGTGGKKQQMFKKKETETDQQDN